MLDSTTASPRRPPSRAAKGEGGARRRSGTMPARFTGAYVTAGPYEDADGERYDVRLERVSGGLRLAEWAAGALRKRAPVLRGSELAALVETARERGVLDTADADALTAALSAEHNGNAPYGASKGRAGDMQEELRVEPLEDGMVRVARWIFRPGPREWELQEAPLMLPAKRYAEALESAARAGLLAP